MPVPEELDYEMWLGPAPGGPYTEKRVHRRKRLRPPRLDAHPRLLRRHDCNWGTHLNDIAQWGNDTETHRPGEVEGRGDFRRAVERAPALRGPLPLRQRRRLFYGSTRAYVRFEGTEGWLGVDDRRRSPRTASILDAPIGTNEVRLAEQRGKVDFVGAIKDAPTTLEPADVGHRTTSVCHIGHIAMQLGRKLRWDP